MMFPPAPAVAADLRVGCHRRPRPLRRAFFGREGLLCLCSRVQEYEGRSRPEMSRSGRLTRERVLIVGAGRAGVSAAEELRRSGFQGEVVVFGDEPGLPYYRPACSKGLLTGSKRPSDLLL